jgi:endo-1,4-beta-xylanase
MGKPMPTLREAARGKFLIGAAIPSSAIEDPATASLLAKQFDTLTGDNEFKPALLQPQPGQFNFAPADPIAAFAKRHSMHLIGHTLCWHQQTPAWMFADAEGRPLPRDRALGNLKSHIDGVLSHFRGRVLGWDVVNEAIPESGDDELRKDAPAMRAIGEDFVERAFEMAHAADPSIELYYNDYNNERPDKRDKTVRLIRKLKAAGLRIDAVGIQAHWNLPGPDLGHVREAIDAFAAEGVGVVITELDLGVLPWRNVGYVMKPEDRAVLDPYTAGCPQAVLDEQARRYGEMFAMFARYAGVVRRVTFWGIDDRRSWLNNFPVRGRTNHALLWDRQMKPKPAYAAVLGALNGHGAA